jgi:hypothetical protein
MKPRGAGSHAGHTASTTWYEAQSGLRGLEQPAGVGCVCLPISAWLDENGTEFAVLPLVPVRDHARAPTLREQVSVCLVGGPAASENLEGQRPSIVVSLAWDNLSADPMGSINYQLEFFVGPLSGASNSGRAQFEVLRAELHEGCSRPFELRVVGETDA